MKFLGLGFLIPTAIAGGYFIGKALDGYFQTHYLYLVFLLLGAVGGMIAMVREARGPQG